MNATFIGLSDAALAIGRSYHATLRLVHVRELEGRKTPHGRWEVSQVSLNRLVQRASSRAAIVEGTAQRLDTRPVKVGR